MSIVHKVPPVSTEIWPRSEIHSTDPRWKPDTHAEHLLAFLEQLILDLARNHPGVTKQDVAAWLASVIAGSPKIEKLEERHLWERKAGLAKDFLAKFPDCTPAKAFLERFKEKFGYEYEL